MTTSGSTVYYHYNGNNDVVYETNASNNIVAEYTYDPNGNPATMTRDSVTYYYHINGHGDVVSLTNGSGAVVASYDYDAYGNIISQSGAMAPINPLRYAGYRYDEATGLYYLMARYYDASVGRFISRDSFHGFTDEPLSLNQYAYCNNNPVMFIDPSGNIALSVLIGGIIGLGAGLIFLPILADTWGLKGTAKKVFVGLGTAALSVIGASLGYASMIAFTKI